MKAKEKPKKPATVRAWKLRNTLEELTKCGVGEERTNAAARLEELHSKFEFTERPESATDLFHGIECTACDDLREIFTFADVHATFSDFVKWAICERFHVEGRWKDQGRKGRTLFLCVVESSVAGLAGLARNIAESFTELWRTFTGLPGATAADARLFTRGLYDGMMQDERGRGELLPRRQVSPGKPGKKKSLTLAGVSLHPYSVALELGRRVRISVPAADLARELEQAEQIARNGTPAISG